jgi:hypothetical protein
MSDQRVIEMFTDEALTESLGAGLIPICGMADQITMRLQAANPDIKFIVGHRPVESVTDLDRVLWEATMPRLNR